MTYFRAVIALIAATLLVQTSVVRAQCDGEWLPGASSSTINGTVFDMIAWDPDGDGPEEEWLVVAGRESNFGYSVTTLVAAFDGLQWRSLGTAPGIAASALAIHNQQLVAVINSQLYRWTDGQWSYGPGANYILSLTEFQGELIASGRFMVDGVDTPGVARLTGNTWTMIGELPSDQAGQTVHRVQVIGDHLFAVGRFDSISGVAARSVARWDGQSWAGYVELEIESLTVREIAEFNGDLVGTGTFIWSGVETSSYARWVDGAWQPMNEGSFEPQWFWPPQMAVFEGELYLEGTYCSSPSFCPLARWRDELRTIESTPDTLAGIRRFTRWRGALTALGMFSLLPEAESSVFRIITRQNGEWRVIPESASGPVRGVTPFQGGLAVCGSFGAIGGNAIGRVARWDGARWHPIGQPFHNGVIDAVWEHQGELYATANAISTPEGPLDGVIRFDGERWQTVPNLNSSNEYCFTSFGDLLVIGGGFATLGGVTASNIAAWDGTTVSPFGSGFNNWVYSVCVFRGELYAAGAFNFSDGVMVGSVARWDGSQWRRLATAAPGGTIYSVCVHQDRLYVGGLFATLPSLGSPSIMAWDGAAWSGVGGGITGVVHDISSDGNQLFIVGAISRAGTQNVNNAARWDGAQWRAMGSGLQSASHQTMLDSAVVEGELVVGSGYLTAGGNPSAFLARWSIAGVPRISDHPADAAASLRAAASFTVTPAPGYDPLNFRWQMHDPPVPGEWRDLADGPLVIAGQEVAALSGAAGATLTIAPSVNFGGMTLRAVVSNDCGEALSDPAILTVSNCDPDLNCDGSADQGDLACLVLALAGDASCFCQSDPDFNLDGSADQGDVAAVISVVAGGECP